MTTDKRAAETLRGRAEALERAYHRALEQAQETHDKLDHAEAERDALRVELEKRSLNRLIRPGGGWVCDLCGEWTTDRNGRIEHKDSCLLALKETS